MTHFNQDTPLWSFISNPTDGQEILARALLSFKLPTRPIEPIIRNFHLG